MKGGYKLCAECGIEQIAWKDNGGEGYSLQGTWYCCRECVAGIGCACNGQPLRLASPEEDAGYAYGADEDLSFDLDEPSSQNHNTRF